MYGAASLARVKSHVASCRRFAHKRKSGMTLDKELRKGFVTKNIIVLVFLGYLLFTVFVE